MIPDDMKMWSPDGYWYDMPMVIGSSCSDTGRARLLYTWLRSMGMDGMDEIKGMW